ncbi:MAG: ABC transporter substrate-binding protein [Flavobacteriales bacterium]
MTEQPLTRIRIAGVPEHFNLPWQLALERRAFVRAGIELKWHTVPEGTGAMCKLLRAGEVDMAMLVTEGAVRDILNGNPCKIVSHYVDTPLTWGVHVGADSAIVKLDELKDVRFAISRHNSGSHLAALAYAKTRGWSAKERELIVVNDLQGAVTRLQQSQPAAFLWEKFTTKPLVDTGVLRRVDEYRPTWPSFVIVATEAVLAEHPKEVKRLLKVIRDQAAGLMGKKTAPEMIAQRYKMGVEDAREWFGAVRWNTDGRVDKTMLREVSDTLFDLGMLEHKATEEEVAGLAG